MRTTLLVIYTERLEDCRAFYAGVGLDFAQEQHGGGPQHYAAVLEDGSVLELYPAGRRGPTGYLRLGLALAADSSLQPLAPGRHTLYDPDGRAVDIFVEEAAPRRLGEGRPADSA